MIQLNFHEKEEALKLYSSTHYCSHLHKNFHWFCISCIWTQFQGGIRCIHPLMNQSLSHRPGAMCIYWIATGDHTLTITVVFFNVISFNLERHFAQGHQSEKTFKTLSLCNFPLIWLNPTYKKERLIWISASGLSKDIPHSQRLLGIRSEFYKYLVGTQIQLAWFNPLILRNYEYHRVNSMH